LGFIFLPPKGGGNNLTRLMRKNTLDKTERKIFTAHSQRNAGIGKIGAAYYLCGKISPREVARQQQNDNK
jgi:hypothetical protein